MLAMKSQCGDRAGKGQIQSMLGRDSGSERQSEKVRGAQTTGRVLMTQVRDGDISVSFPLHRSSGWGHSRQVCRGSSRARPVPT